MSLDLRRPRWMKLAVFLVAGALAAGCGSDAEGSGADAGGADAGTGDSGTPDGGGDGGTTPDGGGGDDVGAPDVGSDADAGGDDGGTPTPDDSDGDGIPNDVEGTGDPDGDGIPNNLDPDSDGDGIPDRIEGALDSDGDGRPDYLDLDSDDDGFDDAQEGSGDTDGDSILDFRDPDADGDGILDADEGAIDSDGDGLVDFLDPDADGDGIGDFYETAEDQDEDGIPNYLDLDSDGDSWSDADEYGQIPGSGEPPVDRDRDRIFDFLDLDSDGDGLSDADELGCPGSSERELADSDGDEISDLLEVAFADGPEDVGQACDPDQGIDDDVDFFFELPYLQGDEQSDVLEFGTTVRRADVAFNMDTTGSMSGEISSLQSSLNSIIFPGLIAELDDVGLAFTQFDDFPCNGHGAGADRPLILRQRVTTNITAATSGVNSLEQHGGSDGPESGFEALYQIATGFGRNNRSNCLGGTAPDGFIVPPFDPSQGYVPDVADGEIGGVGFREGALPIVVHITDAVSHAKGETASGSSGIYQYGATRIETFNALAAIGAKVIGVASGTAARDDLIQLTTNANSVVPPCAWDDFRPFGCSPGQCCTGTNGTGRAPEGTSGLCPLVYDISGSGSGLDSSIVAGIQALINYASFDLTTRVREDETVLDESGIDTSCFISRVVPITFSVPDRSCVTEPVLADLNRDGTIDGFANVTPGSVLTFDVVAYNDCVEPTDRPQVFTAYIDVVEPRGAAVLDSNIVTVLVPPDLKQ